MLFIGNSWTGPHPLLTVVSYNEKFSLMSQSVCSWIFFFNLQCSPNPTNLQERDAKETKLDPEKNIPQAKGP